MMAKANDRPRASCGDHRVDVMREPGAVIGCGIARGERAETDLYAFISNRHEQRVVVEGERAVEEAWRVSERHQEARRRAEDHIGAGFGDM